MSNPARIVDVADAVAAFIKAAWNPAAPDAVARAWVARVSALVDNPKTLTVGRQVFVMPVVPTYQWLARGLTRNGYQLAVLMAERHADRGDPPDSWLDELAAWYERTILYPLYDPGLLVVGPGGVVPGAIPDPETPPEVTTWFDRRMLTDLKTAMVAANFAFTDASDFSGEG